MQPNTYVHQPNAHHGYRRFMARCIVDVSHMGSLPRRTISYTQATAQNMAHPTMDQKLHARHNLQYHTHICACRNRFCRFPRTILNGELKLSLKRYPRRRAMPIAMSLYPEKSQYNCMVNPMVPNMFSMPEYRDGFSNILSTKFPLI